MSCWIGAFVAIIMIVFISNHYHSINVEHEFAAIENHRKAILMADTCEKVLALDTGAKEFSLFERALLCKGSMDSIRQQVYGQQPQYQSRSIPEHSH